MADENKKYITNITDTNNVVYWLKDKEANDSLEELSRKISTPLNYRGVSTSNISDGSTLRIIDLSNVRNYEAVPGDIIIVNKEGKRPLEFIFDGNQWSEFGSTGSLRDLAFYDKVKGSTTLNTSVGVSGVNNTFTNSPKLKGTNKTFSGSGSLTDTSVNLTTSSIDVDVNIEGEISSPDISLKINNTPTTSYTPVVSTTSKTLFTQTISDIGMKINGALTSNYTPKGNIAKIVEGQNDYTPDINISLTKGSFNEVNTVGALPSFDHTVNGEELNITWNPGALMTTKVSDEFVKNVDSATMPELTFVGEPVTFGGQYTIPTISFPATTFTGTSVSIGGVLSDTDLAGSGSFSIDVPVSAKLNNSGVSVNTEVKISETDWGIGPLTLSNPEITIVSTPTTE